MNRPGFVGHSSSKRSGAEKLEFLHRNEVVNGTVTLHAGVAFCLRRFHLLIEDLVRVAAGIPERRIPHDFRRTAVRSYRRSGVTEGVVMKIIGHKTRSIFDRYDIKNEDDLREAAQKVSELGRNGKKAGRVVNIAPGKKPSTT
jgi:hypothetical protein